MTVWDHATMVACAVGLLFSARFVFRYHRLTGGAWRRTPEGRWLMGGRAILTALFLIVITNRLLPEWPGRTQVTFLLMAAFAAQTFVPDRLLTLRQREHATAEKGT